MCVGTERWEKNKQADKTELLFTAQHSVFNKYAADRDNVHRLLSVCSFTKMSVVLLKPAICDALVFSKVYLCYSSC